MKVIVIGSGLGGLSIACLLASQGHDITILEKNDAIGGKINEVQTGGFRFDTGPSLLTMPFILESLFERCGYKLQEFLTIETVNPICRYFYKNGTQFDCYQDSAANISQIKEFAQGDVEVYQDFMNHSQDLYQKTKDSFLFNPLYGITDLSSLKLTDFLHIDAFQTVAESVDTQFTSSELKKFFKRFTTYNGSSPYQAPATLNVIPHVELSLGGYYIKNGMYALIKALHALATKLGVNIATNTPIRRIRLQGKRASGVEGDNQEFYPADIVISNADACETYLNLLNTADSSWLNRTKIEQAEPSCSGFVLLLGLDKQYEQLTHHNIFFSSNYKREFHQIFNQKIMPDDPTIYIANTSHSDPDHAPPGGSNLFVLVNAPYLSNAYHWEEKESQYQNFLINELSQRGLTNLNDHIRFSQTITPRDFYSKYRSNKGSIYGTSSNSKLAAFLRPANKSRSIDGLYLVGGSTHPGGGIPLVTLSAFHAFELIQRYE
ncbi:phytoene desaturase [Aliifodinibius salicampi]|uniref:Phytoene desaturase n=1 Tax=Fodinibius salicampi TaxID=1920655 RepID=A0ABT3PVC7_9BACT|nr:phytoene desaturase family protein [Fodinibius salicampi]MCW9711795.1 phytoene desaturase [Fodinibius salicampi]